MSVNEQTLERIRTQLREARDIGGNVPQDLYSHLTEVFNRILLHHSNDAYDKFEEISALVKQTDIKFKSQKVTQSADAADSDANAAARAWVTRSKNLMNDVNDLINKKDQALLTKSKFVMPNFAEDAEMLEWAGVDFGEEDTYRMGRSFKRLAQMSGAEGLQLFGKIYGTSKDYWIACGKLNTAEETSNGQEARGEGVNELVYWVTDNLLNDWVQLPDARPDHIVTARQIKQAFTGDLNKEITSNPTFDGKERHLLRAQIARIAAGSILCPKGYYEFTEPENEGEKAEMKLADEPPTLNSTELQSQEAWGNLYANILKAGRTTHVKPDDVDEETWEGQVAELAETDKVEERFRAIQEHTKIPGLESSWTSKVVGDAQPYNKGEGTVTFAYNVIRSLRWPGAVTVSKGGKFVNIYVGWGLKRGDVVQNPVEPGIVCDDPVDIKEMPEPFPLHEPAPEEEKDTEKEDGEDDDE